MGGPRVLLRGVSWGVNSRERDAKKELISGSKNGGRKGVGIKNVRRLNTRIGVGVGWRPGSLPSEDCIHKTHGRSKKEMALAAAKHGVKDGRGGETLTIRSETNAFHVIKKLGGKGGNDGLERRLGTAGLAKERKKKKRLTSDFCMAYSTGGYSERVTSKKRNERTSQGKRREKSLLRAVRR